MTSNFERRYVIDRSRESDGPRERHHSIELSDRDHLERLLPPIVSKELEEAGFIYKHPIQSEMPTELKEKFEKAKKITKDTKVIDSRKKDAKSKSKIIKSKSKKTNSKSNRTTVARLQKKL